MSEELYVCRDKDGRCPLRCERMGPFRKRHFLVGDDGNIVFSAWNCLRGNRKDDVVCIPYTPEPELWVCDHKTICPHPFPFCGPKKKEEWMSRGMFSEKGTVCNNNPGKRPTVRAIPYHPESPKKEAPMWELIKPVSIKAIIQAATPTELKCEQFWKEMDDFDDYIRNARCLAPIPTYEYDFDATILPYLKDHPKAMKYAKDKGFIREKQQKTYKRGDVFRVDNDSDCILSYIGDEKMVLVVISDDDKGNYWHHSQPVKDTKKVTEQEMLTLTQNKKFALISE